MKKKVTIIGSGPTCIYFLKQFSDQSKEFKSRFHSITIFEKSHNSGMGMPYNPEMTDLYNLSNISSEEIPALEESFADWLKKQPTEILKNLNVTEFPISKSKVYSRLALGHYLKVQFDLIIEKIKAHGIPVQLNLGIEIVDINPIKNTDQVSLIASKNRVYNGFHKVIISTGHIWLDKDKPDYGYYASPWPICKILPNEDAYYNFTIGTLGASLSAFDVVTSLAHRHGSFQKSEKGFTFKLHKGAQNFNLVMHSAEGWLPHLQYEQEKPIREIYRHTNRDELLSLIEDSGFLSIAVFFDTICRPALLKAASLDGDILLTKLLSQSNFGIKEFVEHMENQHEYVNSFEGMRKELNQARKKMKSEKPTYWMETLDDLMYCLNFHAELLSAEDHLILSKHIMPFLMNVIAALPLESAEILLALYDAGCISLKKGFVEIIEDKNANGNTVIKINNETENSERIEYSMFVNCSGQATIEYEDYPFPTLLKNNFVSRSKAKFKSIPKTSLIKTEKMKNKILTTEDEFYLYTGGIDIDAGYRILDPKGLPSSQISDVSFMHTSGCRPYSYGLQACNATSTLLIEQFKKEFLDHSFRENITIEEITEIYESKDNL